LGYERCVSIIDAAVRLLPESFTANEESAKSRFHIQPGLFWNIPQIHKDLAGLS